MDNKKFWRTNIPDPMWYVKTLREHVRECEGTELTAERLAEAIAEDSHESITVEECQRLLDEERSEQ
jgi:hypothetical protein